MKKGMKQNTVYYLLLVLLILFTSGLAFLLMPLIMIGDSVTVYAVGLMMGIVFGLLIVFFIMGMDDLTHHHHAGIWLVILFGSLLNFTAVFVNKIVIFGSVFVPKDSANIFIAAVLFALGFYLPYVVYLINEHKLDKYAQKSN